MKLSRVPDLLLTPDDIAAIRAVHTNVEPTVGEDVEGSCDVCCYWPCEVVLLCDALETAWVLLAVLDGRRS